MLKRHTITLFALMGFIVSALAVVSTDGVVKYDNPTGAKLEENEEYQRLMVENDRMKMMNDSIQMLLNEVKEERRLYLDTLTTEPSREIMHRYSQRIVNLEDEMFNITQKQGEIASRINDIEMSIIAADFINVFDNSAKQNSKDAAKEEEAPVVENNENMEAPADESTEGANATEGEDQTVSETEESQPTEDSSTATEAVEPTEEPVVVPRRNIIDDDRFINSLGEKDLNDLRMAQQEESNTEALVGEYIKQYEILNATASAYDNARDQQTADSIYTEFAAMVETLDALNNEINRKWNFVVDTKYYAYGYIIEKERNKELLNRLDDRFNTTLQQCANNDGLYSSNGVMHYAISRPVIVDLELELSTALGINDAIDSLSTARNTLVTPNYHLAPIELPERRLFIDYHDITFGRTNYYSSSNPVPEVKVYERGTIYRILLGIFKSQQPMTLFKGVRPLYIQKDDSGLHHYYAGGFATYDEAKAAQRELFDKGFKAPEICCWMDGVMTNLSLESDTSDDTQPVEGAAKRYMLRIMEQDMSDAIKQRIAELHPTKMISLTKDGYVVGSFEGHDEVTRLFITLGDEFGINLEILEVEVK